MPKGEKGDKMRIAMIGHKEYPSQTGGVEAFVSGLAPCLAQRGHDVTVYDRGLRPGRNCYTVDGVRVRRIFTVQKPALYATIYSFLATFDALFRGYDVIHYHAIGPSVPLIIAKLFGKRTVCTVHGLNWKVDKWKGFASHYLKLGERIAARCADELVVLSESEQAYFWQTYQRRATRIPNAIRTYDPLPDKEIGRRYGLEPGGYILYVGRFSPEKGVQELVEAFQNANTGKKLVLVGPLDQTEYCRMILAQIRDRTDILAPGYLQGDLLRELYSNCALFVLPSHTEGLSLSLLEALSVGVLCLASDIAENTALAGSYGTYFRAGDPTDLAQRMEQLCAQQSGLIRRVEQMRYFREHYDHQRMVERYEAAYCRVVNG